jgi:hypothetical protein
MSEDRVDAWLEFGRLCGQTLVLGQGVIVTATLAALGLLRGGPWLLVAALAVCGVLSTWLTALSWQRTRAAWPRRVR